MKYATAVRRLRQIAEDAPRLAVPWEDPVLLEIYTYGAIFDAPSELDGVDVALVLDAPADELSWGAEPPWTLGVVELLRLNKSPVRWTFRPKARPVWNHAIQQPLRIYSLTDGPDQEALTALTDRKADRLRLPAPSPEEYEKQVGVELDAAWQHLRQVRDDFWERDWRGEHKGFGIYPESHLWNAVLGYTSLREAVGR